MIETAAPRLPLATEPGAPVLSPAARKPWWRWIAAFLPPVLAAVVVWGVLGRGTVLTQSLDLLSHCAPGWLVVAGGCEVVSFLGYAGAQQRLAGAAGHRLSVGWLASLAVAAQTLGNFLPGGYVAANVFNFRQLRRRQLSAPVAGWLLLVSSILYIGVLAVLALVGSGLAGPSGGGVAGAVRIVAVVVIGGILLATVGAAVIASRRRARGIALGGLTWLARRLGRSPESAMELMTVTRERLGAVRLSPGTASGAGALFVVGWLSDAACLVCSLIAVGVTPPWAGLLLAYCGAQLMSFVPLSPGGLGLVEGSLALTLTATGGHAARVMAGVLLYRAVSYWATLPAGAAGYALVRRGDSGQPPRPA